MAIGALGLATDQQAWFGTTDEGAEVFIMQFYQGYEARLSKGRFVYRIRSVDGRKGVLETYDARRFKEAPNDGVASGVPG